MTNQLMLFFLHVGWFCGCGCGCVCKSEEAPGNILMREKEKTRERKINVVNLFFAVEKIVLRVLVNSFLVGVGVSRSACLELERVECMQLCGRYLLADDRAGTA